jgi:hypothetical protein
MLIQTRQSSMQLQPLTLQLCHNQDSSSCGFCASQRIKPLQTPSSPLNCCCCHCCSMCRLLLLLAVAAGEADALQHLFGHEKQLRDRNSLLVRADSMSVHLSSLY